MAVQIIVNQTGKPAGVAGRAREDLALGVPVQLSAAGGPFLSYLWRVLWRPINILASTRATSALVTPTSANSLLSPIDGVGTYRVELAVDSGSGLGATAADLARITFYAGPTLSSDPRAFPRRFPAVGETTEHNVPDALDPLGNVDGWARERAKMDLILQTLMATGPTFGNGLVLINPARVTTTNATPTTLISVPMPAGEYGIFKLKVIGKGPGPTLYKASGEIVRLNDAGVLTTKQSTSVGTDLNEIGVGGVTFGLAAGSFLVQVTGKIGTTVEWTGSLEALVSG